MSTFVRALYRTKVRLGIAGAMLATTSRFTADACAFAGSTCDLALKDHNGVGADPAPNAGEAPQ